MLPCFSATIFRGLRCTPLQLAVAFAHWNIMIVFTLVCCHDGFWVQGSPFNMLAYTASLVRAFIITPETTFSFKRRHAHILAQIIVTVLSFNLGNHAQPPSHNMVTRLLLPLDNPDVGNNYNKLLKNKTVNKIPSTLHIPIRCCLVLFLQFSYFSLFTIKAAYSYSRRNHFAPVVKKERYSILCSFNGS